MAPPHAHAATRGTAALAAAAAVVIASTGTTQAVRPDVARTPHAAAARVSSGPGLTIDLAGGHPAISPLIYGVNGATEKFARAARLPLDRWGGDSAETYNWKVRSSNTGSGYFFENISDCFRAGVCTSNPSYSAPEARIALDRRVHATTLLTLPMMGYVAKDAPIEHPLTCGFPESGQDAYDPYDAGCGNGLQQGHPIPSDPTNAGVSFPAPYAGAWVKHLVAKYKDARHGGVGVYGLGEQPALWDQTWRAFHPDATTYDEEYDKASALAVAVKAADPTAATLGPSEWGWPNYQCSGADHAEETGCLSSDPDRAAHGGLGLSQWYLKQFAAYQKAHGRRLLDYFDLHYYPAGRDAQHPLDVTRSLWDPTYDDPSYIDAPVRLIPRMRDWVTGSYPGTKTSLSEYDLSDPTLDTRQNALIEADALGIFGQQHLGLASFTAEGGSTPTAAFTMFRNYDGKGAAFGDRLVSAVSAGRGKLAVYAARRGPHGALTILVINKTTTTLRSSVALQHRGTGKRSKRAPVYRYSGGAIGRSGSVVLTQHGFVTSFPGESITMIAIAKTG